jgi:hypothetical protein
MSLSTLLKRLGALLMVGAFAALVFAPLLAERLPADTPIKVGVLAGVFLALGFLFETLGVGRRRCLRCGRPAHGGSTMCAEHQRELMRMTRDVVARQHRQ